MSDVSGVRSRRRRRRRWPLVVGVLAALVLSVVGGYALYLNSLVSGQLRRSELLPPSEQRTVHRDPRAGDAQNILLLGSDSRSDTLGAGSRADVIQLVHVSADRGRLDVVHFPRDLYVAIPGHGRNKLNAAYAWGGAPLLVLTLEGLLDVRIDHVAEVSFDGFKQLTDRLGGVDVYARQPSDEFGYRFEVGINHVDGEAALAFVRQRHQLALGDIDRGQRQQAWMRAVIGKTLEAGVLLNPVKLAGAIKDITANMVVDESMTAGYIRSLALSLRALRTDDIVFRTAPYRGFGDVAGVGSVVWVDETEMSRLGRGLRTDGMSEVPGGSTRPG